VGVLARVFEAAGLSTTSTSLVREHTEKVKPPRALWVPFPFGRPLNRPNDPAAQLSVIRAALALLDAPSGPVLVDYQDPEGPSDEEDVNLPQAASVQLSAAAPRDVAFEVTALRPYYEQFVAAHDGRTAVGLSGVDQRRFRGLVRLLEAYAAGADEADLPELPERRPETPLPQLIRWGIDDLKAFYFEARLQQRPGSSWQELHTWLWGETAAGGLFRAVRDRMKASGDPRLEAMAFGIAR
jgi:hypothetical protein